MESDGEDVCFEMGDLVWVKSEPSRRQPYRIAGFVMIDGTADNTAALLERDGEIRWFREEWLLPASQPADNLDRAQTSALKALEQDNHSTPTRFGGVIDPA